METTTLLYITLIIYLIIMIFAYMFNIRWLYFIGGLLWFVPVTQLDNAFLVLISVIMVLAHGILGFYSPKGSDFE